MILDVKEKKLKGLTPHVTQVHIVSTKRSGLATSSIHKKQVLMPTAHLLCVVKVPTMGHNYTAIKASKSITSMFPLSVFFKSLLSRDMQ